MAMEPDRGLSSMERSDIAAIRRKERVDTVTIHLIQRGLLVDAGSRWGKRSLASSLEIPSV